MAKEHPIENANNSIIRKVTLDTGVATIGALVGFLIGGPTGIIVGAATPPILGNTIGFINRSLEKKKKRAEGIVLNSFNFANLSVNEGLEILDTQETNSDYFVNLLKQAIDSDPVLDKTFSILMGEMLNARNDIKRERLMLLGDTIRNLRSTHIKILRALKSSGGKLKPKVIAKNINIPEVELRYVVRDLELRGMIKDTGKHPTEWQLRTLGKSIAKYID